jgi:probable HAF family extracellular repeat protein
MKSRFANCLVAVTVFAATAFPFRLAAQDGQHDHHYHHHYKLVDMGTFGGPNSGYSNPFPLEGGLLNNWGAVVGVADTTSPDPFAPNCMTGTCYLGHAFRWEDGVRTDLGALPGNNTSYAFWTSNDGLTTGDSENGAIDPLTGFPDTEAVLWRNGQIIDLGTLGGNASSASAVNTHGQVVGAALNTIPDSFSAGINPPIFFFPVATQAHAFLWDGVMHDLGTLGGPDSGAFYVNEHGQVAGYSYTNSTPNPTTGVPTLDPFLWEDGKMKDLGTLGGTLGVPYSMNERGQVVGQSNLAGDQTAHPFLSERGKPMIDLGTLGGTFGRADGINRAGHIVGLSSPPSDGPVFAFLWENEVMQNLGTVDGDPCSEGLFINARDQVVGGSWDCGNEFQHSFLWENGSIVDLLSLVPSGSGMVFKVPASINDRGEIALQGILSNGDLHAILLIPCDEDHLGIEGCDYSLVEAHSAATGSMLLTDKPAAVNQSNPSFRTRNPMRPRFDRRLVP